MDQFEEWRKAEHAAVEAEAAVAGLGRGAALPASAALAFHAKELRARADAILLAQLRTAGAAMPATIRTTIAFKTGDTVEPRAGGPHMKVRSLTDRYVLCQWRDETGKRHVQVFGVERLALVDGARNAPPDQLGSKPAA